MTVDDCWTATTRNSDGNLQADGARFPDGMRALADYVHSNGLRFGLYESPTQGTRQLRPGSYGHGDSVAGDLAQCGDRDGGCGHLERRRAGKLPWSGATVGFGAATSRAAEHGVSQRSHGDTSTARTRRPVEAGQRHVSQQARSLLASIRPRLRAPYNAPCPRGCSGTSGDSTGVVTGPSTHGSAWVGSNR
ncbi:hypothetical protein ADK64_32700 [Streptomyces sp. MMG1121]|nr:hypothetical protein ADK64_32700 [Streptomyces sp. MMG1121]